MGKRKAFIYLFSTVTAMVLANYFVRLVYVDAKNRAIKNKLESIGCILSAYRQEYGRLPVSLANGDVLGVSKGTHQKLFSLDGMSAGSAGRVVVEGEIVGDFIYKGGVNFNAGSQVFPVLVPKDKSEHKMQYILLSDGTVVVRE
jgi:hypothetical protein